MSTSPSPPRGHQYPPERGPLRQQRRAAATRMLAGYVDAVAAAVRAEGFTIVDIRIAAGPDLEACITVLGAQDHLATGQSTDPKVDLAWAEDTGWSVAHHLLGTSASPWRYLHLELVPSPRTVAAFLTAVLANSDDVGMPYPARFRFRNQSLQPVLDDLGRRTPTTPQLHSH